MPSGEGLTGRDAVKGVFIEDERKYKVCNYIKAMRSLKLRNCTSNFEIRCPSMPRAEFEIHEDVLVELSVDEDLLYDFMLSVLARNILNVFNVDEGRLYNVLIANDVDHVSIYGVSYYYFVEAVPDASKCDQVILQRFLII